METLKRQLPKMEKKERLNILDNLKNTSKNTIVKEQQIIKKTTILSFD